jgi:hypothetical protein
MSRMKCVYELSSYLNIFIAREDSYSSEPLNVKSVTVDGKPAELKSFDVDYDGAESTLNIDGDTFRVVWDNGTGEFSIDRETCIVTIYFKVAGRHIVISSDYAVALYYYYDTEALVDNFLNAMEDYGVEFTKDMSSIARALSLNADYTKYNKESPIVKYNKDKLINMYRYCISKVDELCDEELVDYL